jgi:hypothetical protein
MTKNVPLTLESNDYRGVGITNATSVREDALRVRNMRVDNSMLL